MCRAPHREREMVLSPERFEVVHRPGRIITRKIMNGRQSEYILVSGKEVRTYPDTLLMISSVCVSCSM